MARSDLRAGFGGVLAVVTALATGLIPAVLTAKRTESACAAQVGERPPAGRVLKSQKSWPMFRGEKRLLGRAAGMLPDSMSLMWKFEAKDEIKSSPVIDANVVFVGSSDANVYAIDLYTGGQVWAYTTDGPVEATPCVVGGSVYVGSSDEFLYSLDAKNGALRWKYQTEGQILGGANWTLSPDERDVWILVGSYDNRLHCVNSADGNMVWTYETGSYINGSPAVAEGKVAFGGCDEMIHVVSAADGGKLGEIDCGSFIPASPAVFGGQAYVGSYQDVFVRADMATGKIAWRYEQAQGAFFSSPAVGDDVVVVGSRDRQVHCISRDQGTLVWKFKTLGDVDSSPVICGDKVVVGCEDGRLYSLRLSDGKQVWSYEIGQPITSSAAVAGGMVVIGCDDGRVYAFGAKKRN